MYTLKILVIFFLIILEPYLFDNAFSELYLSLIVENDFLLSHIETSYLIIKLLTYATLIAVCLKIITIKPPPLRYKLTLPIILAILVAFSLASFIANYIDGVILLILDKNYLYRLNIDSVPMFDTNEEGIDWRSVFSAALVYCILIPIFEEFIYRRILVNAFSQKVPVLLAFTLSSIMFSLHHERIIASFFLGFVLCYIYRNFGLMVSIIVHIGYNLFILVYALLYFKTVGHHYFSITQESLIPSYKVILSTVIIIILARVIWKRVVFQTIDKTQYPN